VSLRQQILEAYNIGPKSAAQKSEAVGAMVGKAQEAAARPAEKTASPVAKSAERPEKSSDKHVDKKAPARK